MTPIENLTIMNDFLFSVIMRQEKFCKPLLEYILNIKIDHVEYINEQESLQSASPTAKSVRLDVFIEDDLGTVYDIEVQTTNEHNIGKRRRYYQSMMDIRLLEKGKQYQDLKKSFIIFICNFDPFQASKYVYTFKSCCEEEKDILLDDEATTVIINTKGTVGEINDELKAVIQYMDTGIVSNDYTESLDEEVVSVKSDEKVRMSYMLMQEMIWRERANERHENTVTLLRGIMNEFSLTNLARIMQITANNCKSIINTIQSHPDWDDEQVARAVCWDN